MKNGWLALSLETNLLPLLRTLHLKLRNGYGLQDLLLDHIQKGHVLAHDHQILLASGCSKAVHKGGVHKLLLVGWLHQDVLDLAVDCTVLLHYEAFRVEDSRVTHPLEVGFVLEHQCVVFDALCCFWGEVDYACHWLDYQPCQPFSCPFHEPNRTFFACTSVGLGENASDAWLEAIENSLPSFFQPLKHILRSSHLLLLSVLLEVFVEGEGSQPCWNCSGYFGEGVEGSTHWVSHERTCALSDSFAQLGWTLDEPLGWLFGEVLEASGDVTQ